MNRIILCILCLFLSLAGNAQHSFELNLSNEGNASVPFAQVLVEPGSHQLQSDASGKMQIDLEKGTYQLKVHLIGFKSIDTSFDLNSNLSLSLKLKEQMLDLPEFVVRSQTLTGGLNSSFKTAGSAQYLSPKELDRFSYTDINRSLRAVPGINIQEEDGFGLRPNIGLRGTGVERSSKITLMEDGVLMAPAPYAASSAYYFPTIGRMQAIEVMKGSSQVRFGPYTTGGAINLISTQIPNKLSARVGMSAGSFGTNNLHAYAGNNHGQFAYLVETFQFGSDGFKNLDKGGNTGFEKDDYTFKFRFNTSEKAKVYQSVSFKLGFSTERSNETYLGLTEDDFAISPFRRYAGSREDLMLTDFRQLSAKHIIVPAKNTHITTTLYRNDFNRNWYKLDKDSDANGNTSSISSILASPEEHTEQMHLIEGGGDPNGRLWVKANNRSYFSQGIQSNFSKSFNSGGFKHQVEFSVRLHEDQMDRFQWVDGYSMNEGQMSLEESGVAGTESNRIEHAQAIASYVQYELQAGHFTIVPGVRHEYIELEREDYGKNDPSRTGVDLKTRTNTVSAFVPGLSVSYESMKGANIFGGVHRGFAPPSSAEGSLPEESVNMELGYKQQTKKAAVQAILFMNNYTNLLGTDLAAAGGGGSTELYNGGAARTQGLEFLLSYNLSSELFKKVRFPMSLVYTYTDAYFRNNFESSFEGWGSVSSGDELPYLAHHQGTAMIGVESQKLDFNLSTRYSGQMRTVAGAGDILTQESTDEQFIIDASLTFRILPKLRMEFRGNNLSNQVYVVSRRPAGLRPGLPRSFTAGFRLDLP